MSAQSGSLAGASVFFVKGEAELLAPCEVSLDMRDDMLRARCLPLLMAWQCTIIERGRVALWKRYISRDVGSR